MRAALKTKGKRGRLNYSALGGYGFRWCRPGPHLGGVENLGWFFEGRLINRTGVPS